MTAGVQGKRIAVTGASGFIGRAAVRALVSEGAEVVALLRNRHGLAGLRGLGAGPAVAPLRQGPALAGALAGAEVLVHLAYDVRADAAANLAAFDALLAAARDAGVRQIVHASSVVVYDDWPAGRIDETAPIGGRPAQGYRAAKIAMEERLLSGPTPATILQPTIVWGSGSALWTERPMRQLRAAGLVLPEPCGEAPLVHVMDVARAIVAAAARTAPEMARVLVFGPESPRWDALFEGYRAIAGGVLIREPAAQMLAAAAAAPTGSGGPGVAARASAALRMVLGRQRFERLLDHAAALSPGRAPARPGPADLALFTASPRIETRRATELLGFNARVGLAEGLRMLREEHAPTVS